MKHLLKMMDLSTEEIIEILNLADQLKYELKHGIPHDHLKGKTLGMIFRKASTRTRVSFETGMYQLGGNPLYLSASDMQIGISFATCSLTPFATQPTQSTEPSSFLAPQIKFCRSFSMTSCFFFAIARRTRSARP